MKKNNTLLTLGMLIKRNVKLFLKDKMTVFFSVLAPIIILLIYVLFLGKIQIDTINSTLVSNGIEIERAAIRAMINNWMIAGVMGVSCITVSVNANIVMVKDRATGAINDTLASPVKRWVIYASYVIACFIVTLSICLIVLLVSLIFLACTGGFLLNFGDFFAILGITIISTLSSSLFTAILCIFIKTPSALAAVNGAFSTAIGFLIGAYLPFSMLPKAMQYLGCFIPGTYSAGLFKNYFLRGPLEVLAGKINNPELIDGLMKDYSVNLEFFGMRISSAWMVFALIISIVVFAGVLFAIYSNKKTNIFAVSKKKKSTKKVKRG